jgi:hypothetical protein
VAAHVERNYAGDAWYKLLSSHGGWGPDDELASAWVAIHAPRRLAKVTFGLLDLPRDIAVACLAEVVSGIKNDAWQSSALAFLAERIGAGSSPFEVLDLEQPALLPPAYDHIHRAAGALVVEAWNHRLSVVIRFGGRGLYVAMAEDGETSQPPIQLIVV